MAQVEREPSAGTARWWGVVAALVLIAVVVGLDVVEGPRTAYVGVLTCAPFLTAVFARPVDTAAVGVAAILAGHAYAVTAGAGADHAQVVRLGFLTAAAVVATGAARLREARDRRLSEVTDIAEVAQATILRPVPRLVGPLALAGRYASAASAAHVGGDLYDVADTPHGVRLIVGDVRGKGLDAVRLAAAVLGAFREAAFAAGPDLGQLVGRVADTVVRHADAEDFVTAVFVQVGPTGAAQVVNCGHPAPLRVDRAGRVVPVEPAETAPPLGLASSPGVVDVVLGPGERLLLYTDGLSEARDGSGAFLALPAAASGVGAGSLDDALDALLATTRRHVGGRLRDDLALLLLECRTPLRHDAVGAGRATPSDTRPTTS